MGEGYACEGEWGGGGYASKRTTGGILVVIELFCILTVVVVDTRTPTCDETTQNTNTCMRLQVKWGKMELGPMDYVNVNILTVMLYYLVLQDVTVGAGSEG